MSKLSIWTLISFLFSILCLNDITDFVICSESIKLSRNKFPALYGTGKEIYKICTLILIDFIVIYEVV